MLVDSHQHTNWHGKNCDAVIADMDRAGIDVSWLLTWEVPPHEYDLYYTDVFDPRHVGLPLEDVVHACERHPRRFVPGYAPDPRRPDAIERLEAAVRMYGVRVYGELKVRILLDDPDVIHVFRACGRLGLPIVLHIDEPLKERPKPPARDYWYCADIHRLETALRQCPETIFIGHAPGFWRHISGDADTSPPGYPKGAATPGGRVLALLEKYKNLYADLSAGSGLNALARGPEGRGRQFLIDFQDKLLYGRDCFDDNLMNFIRSAQLPAEAFEKITSKNALKLVPL